MMPSLRRTVERYAYSVRNLVAPRYCLVCGRRLSYGERYCCLGCLAAFPYTYTWVPGNDQVERLFSVHIPLERAASLVRYNEVTRRFLLSVKYFSAPKIGEYVGEIMANRLLPTGFFRGVDVIVPIPLYKVRARERGYNQSDCIARGLSRKTGLPMDAGVVVRTRHNPTQTHLTRMERRENVRDLFAVTHPERLQGKHILLIDDVLTTGSTLLSCAVVLAEVPGVTLSILTFARA
jgi:ComF family protein